LLHTVICRFTPKYCRYNIVKQFRRNVRELD